MNNEIKRIEDQINTDNAIVGNNTLSAVVIKVFNDGDGIDKAICYCNDFFRDNLMNGDYPQDNFDNCEYIPNDIGMYEFDIEYGGGSSFNGETTEYDYWCRLRNCRPYNNL